jgi:hypothetical protein
MVSVEGEAMRPVTWVTIEEVASGEWGNAGKAPHTGDVVAYRQGNKQILLIGSFWCPLATPFMWRHSTTEGKATERRRLASCPSAGRGAAAQHRRLHPETWALVVIDPRTSR